MNGITKEINQKIQEIEEKEHVACFMQWSRGAAHGALLHRIAIMMYGLFM